MALPFVAGLAVGAGVALLFTKREQIKQKLSNSELSENIQKGLSNSINKGKEISSNALNYAKTSLANALNTESKTEEPQAQKTQITRKTTKIKDNKW
ncbi:YtxH domain-containing protein [Helicobacter sp.]|uniref:YtxH domain-containing protein n=1 Tax=Helicobacter sp. TaxID=218 RepID=UPI0025B92CF8|nr:YtxH domain-containing protein [Helicobacter sp.]MCI5969364.1 YtxH domain-containing protein [Helicobacter sp.]MDY2585618.1 YtxH domain-containing protein [Helicobacter sp.]